MAFHTSTVRTTRNSSKPIIIPHNKFGMRKTKSSSHTHHLSPPKSSSTFSNNLHHSSTSSLSTNQSKQSSSPSPSPFKIHDSPPISPTTTSSTTSCSPTSSLSNTQSKQSSVPSPSSFQIHDFPSISPSTTSSTTPNLHPTIKYKTYAQATISQECNIQEFNRLWFQFKTTMHTVITISTHSTTSNKPIKINSSAMSTPLSRVTSNIIDDKTHINVTPSSNDSSATISPPNSSSAMSTPLSRVTSNIIDDKTDINVTPSSNNSSTTVSPPNTATSCPLSRVTSHMIDDKTDINVTTSSHKPSLSISPSNTATSCSLSQENISPSTTPQKNSAISCSLSGVTDTSNIIDDKTDTKDIATSLATNKSSSQFKLFTQYEVPDLCGYFRTKFLCDIIQSHILYYKDILNCSSTPKRTLLELKINMFLCLVQLMDSMYCSSSDYCKHLPVSQSSIYEPDRRRVTKPFVPIYHTMRDPILLQCLLDLLPKSLPIQKLYSDNNSMGMPRTMITKQLLKNLCQNHLITLQSCTSLISLFDPSYSHISNDFILSTLVDHKTCFFLNISKIVNHSYILLHTSQFGTYYRSIIQETLIQHNLYYHKLPLDEFHDENDPWPCHECCPRCTIFSNALLPPHRYINAEEYFCCIHDIHNTPLNDFSKQHFQKLQFPHTPLTFHHTPSTISSVSHPLSRVTFNIIDDKIATTDIHSTNLSPITFQHTPANSFSVSRPLSQVTFNLIDDKTDTKHFSSLHSTFVTSNHNPISSQHIPLHFNSISSGI